MAVWTGLVTSSCFIQMPFASRRAQGLLISGLLVTSSALLADMACAQQDLRSAFPGRRVGGGTRGECNARVVAHLVPSQSVFAPDGYLAVVMGPTASPVPLHVVFRPEKGGASALTSTVPSRTLPAAPAGLTLLPISAPAQPTVWESSFDCSAGDASRASADPLAFVESSSPPAVSLLVPSPEEDDASIQKGLARLHSACGSSVPTIRTLAEFGLADLATSDWPELLPVRCPS